jgi:hypothetical protein
MSHDLETFEITEGTTPDYTATLLDKDGVAVPGSVLDSLLLTYFQEYTGAIINGRDSQSVLQINGITVDEDGKLIWTLSLADAAILDNSLHEEPHIAQFMFTYPGVGGSTEVSRHKVRFLVQNQDKVS